MFKRLFEPTTIGKVNIKNRIAMAPIVVFNLFDDEGVITTRAIDYYVERAKGGVGLIVAAVFHVANDIENYTLHGRPLWPLCTPKALPMFTELAEYVHSYGSRIFFQLTAGVGRNASAEAVKHGFKPISASATPVFGNADVTARELSVEELKKIVTHFGEAAELLVAANIDGIEINGHEGYLIDSFTTAVWNRRNDEYGGSLESRLRFPSEIVKRIKDTAGKDFPVVYRYGLRHYLKEPQVGTLEGEGYKESGRDVQEGLKMAKHLEEEGVDAFHVDAGCYESFYWPHPPIYQPHGCMVDMASEVKRVVNVPVIAVGRLEIPHLADKVLEDQKADIIALGRGLLADPYWPKKVLEGRVEDIRPCIGCHDGCFPSAGFLSCSVNPACGRERLYALHHVWKAKRVLIIGGGVAGMEVARVSAIRGHEAVLYEKTDKLGGHLWEASTPDFKEDIRRLLTWYLHQVKKLRIEVHLKTEVDPKFLMEEKPDVVVVATGSKPAPVNILGNEKLQVVNCCDLLLEKERAGDSVVVYGGGLEGCETALWLARQGKIVNVVARHDAMSKGVFEANRKMLLEMLTSKGVGILTNTIIKEATDGGVIVVEKNAERKIDCDTLVVATGLKPEKELYDYLVNKIPEIYEIGDCKEARKIHNAVFEGYMVGLAI